MMGEQKASATHRHEAVPVDGGDIARLEPTVFVYSRLVGLRQNTSTLDLLPITSCANRCSLAVGSICLPGMPACQATYLEVTLHGNRPSDLRRVQVHHQHWL